MGAQHILALVWSTTLAVGQGLPIPPSAPVHPVQVSPSELKIIYRPAAPVYPPLAKLSGVQGTVGLQLSVNELGMPWNVKGVEGPLPLRPAAEAFVRQWLFEPVWKDGKPVYVHSVLRIAFRLQDVPNLDAPLPAVRLVVESPDGGPKLPVDLAPLKKSVTEKLEALGFPVQAADTGLPEDALSIRLRVRTLKTASGSVICEVVGRLSRWRDRLLEDNEPGKPQRVWQVGCVSGQRGTVGLADRVSQNLLRMLGELAAPPLPRAERAREGVARAEAEAAPMWRNAAGAFPVVDFDFSQLRVKHQPPAPPYPSLAKANRIQGLVIVLLTIDPDGRPIEAEAQEGPPELLVTALDYALQWSFEPARLNGVGQYARFKLTMPFRLR